MTDQGSALFENKVLILLDELLRARSQEIHQRKPIIISKKQTNSPDQINLPDLRDFARRRRAGEQEPASAVNS